MHFVMPEVLQSVWGCTGLFCTCEEFKGIGKQRKKKTYCGSSRGTNGNIKEELVTVNEKLQQAYIDQCYMMKDSVNEHFSLEHVKAEETTSLDIKNQTLMFQ